MRQQSAKSKRNCDMKQAKQQLARYSQLLEHVQKTATKFRWKLGALQVGAQHRRSVKSLGKQFYG